MPKKETTNRLLKKEPKAGSGNRTSLQKGHLWAFCERFLEQIAAPAAGAGVVPEPANFTAKAWLCLLARQAELSREIAIAETSPAGAMETMAINEDLLQPVEAGSATRDQVVAAAALVASADEAMAARARRAVLGQLDRIAAKTDKFEALLNSIAEHYANEPVVAEFVNNARPAHEQIMQAAYQKIIEPKSGTPCCPQCGSGSIAEVGGAYEFTQMHCYDCDNDEYCDSYQVGDWYK